MNPSFRQCAMRTAGADMSQALGPSLWCGGRRSSLHTTVCQAYSNQSNGATMTPAAQSKAVAESQRSKPRQQKMTLFKALSFAGPAPGTPLPLVSGTPSRASEKTIYSPHFPHVHFLRFGLCSSRDSCRRSGCVDEAVPCACFVHCGRSASDHLFLLVKLSLRYSW